MNRVVASIPEAWLEDRKRTGADQYDEMWEGVLHMPPMPNRFHQELERDLIVYLCNRWVPFSGGRVYHQINLASIGGWPRNYRIPDLVLLLPQRFAIDRNEYFEGAPDIVVEIHSPDDETYEKLPFYAKLGVPEVWVFHRDTKKPEVHLRRRGRYQLQRPDADGWLRSPVIGLEMKAARGSKLAVRMGKDDATRQLLPSD